MTDREDAYRALFDAHFPAVLGYALRRTDSPDDAADVAAEAMLVAWRRFADVPAGDEARLWLFGVARRVLANHHRGADRRARLGLRFREHVAGALAAASGRTEADDVLHAALAALRAADRELLTLTAWEELTPAEAAAVLGISAEAARARLHRARERLREELARRGRTKSGHAGTRRGHVGVGGCPSARREEQ